MQSVVASHPILAAADASSAVDEASIAAAWLEAFPGPAVIFDAANSPTGITASCGDYLAELDGDGGRAQRDTLLRLVGATRRTGEASRETVVRQCGTKWLELIVLPGPNGHVLVLARDATLEARVQHALVDSRQRYKDLAELAGDFVWETDADGALTFVSSGQTLGYAPDELIGVRPRTLLVEPLANPAHLPFEAREQIANAELWLVHRQGGHVCLQCAATPLFDTHGRRRGARGYGRDVTAERQREFKLARAEKRAQVVDHILERIRNGTQTQDMVDSAVEAVRAALSADSAAIFLTEQSDQFVCVAGQGDAARVGAAALLADCGDDVAVIDDLVGADNILVRKTRCRGTYNGAIAVARRTEWAAEDRLLVAAVEAQLGAVLAQILDQRRLEQMSRTDPLTGLLNRRAFLTGLDVRILRPTRQVIGGALLYIDLDNFKPVNDLHGHARGDEALRRVAALLRQNSRPYDLAARLGGDEFALWLDGIDGASADRRARRLVDDATVLKQYSAKTDNCLGISLGIAMSDPNGGESVEQLLSRADGALYAAKRDGKNRCVMADAAETEAGR